MVKRSKSIRPWLDIFSLAAWGVLLLQFWLTNQLNLLIHPAYHWLTIAAGLALLLVSGLQARELLRKRRYRFTNAQHLNFFHLQYLLKHFNFYVTWTKRQAHYTPTHMYKNKICYYSTKSK